MHIDDFKFATEGTTTHQIFEYFARVRNNSMESNVVVKSLQLLGPNLFFLIWKN